MLAEAVMAGSALAAWPFAREAMRPLPGAVGAGGCLADLGAGRLWYRWDGPRDAPIAVCVHGLTTPSVAFHALVPLLVDKGYRVLTFDLYGRGLSERPRGAQDAAFFRSMLTGLLDHVGARAPVTLVGYSMGGAIVTDFAAHHPERVRRLVLLAPAGMGADLGRLAAFAARWKGVGDWAFHAGYPGVLRRATASDGQGAGRDAVGRAIAAELRQRGYLRSVLASLRGILRQDIQPAHVAVARHGLCVTAIWGRDDPVIPLRARDRLAAWNPGVRHVTVRTADHGLPYTHAPAVADAIPKAD